MKIRKGKSILYWILFLSFVSFALINNYIWIKGDSSVRGVDSQNHLLFSIKFFYIISDIIHEKSFSLWMEAKQILILLGRPMSEGGIQWPNGLNFSASLLYSFFGKSLFSAKLTLLPYIFILLLSTYLIGRLICSDFVGLTATFILFMYPIIFESSRQFQLDFPLTAMITLNILFLLKSDNFKNRKYSFLFGISLGCAMLIKGQTLLYLIWPISWLLYDTFRNSGGEISRLRLKSRQLQNMVIFIIVSGLLASIWWGPQIKYVLHFLRDYVLNPQTLMKLKWPIEKKYSFESMSFYFRMLFHILGSFFFLLFLISFVIFLKQKIKYKAIILSWLIFPFLLFSLVFVLKYSRFLMPLTPPVAIITACSLQQMRIRGLRNFILLIIIVFALMQFYILSWCDFHYRDFRIGKLQIFGRLGYGSDYEAPPPHKDKLKIEEIVRIIRQNTSPTQPVKIGLVNCGLRYGTFEMCYWLKLEDRFLYPTDFVEMYRDFFENFESIDFILLYLPVNSPLRWPKGKEFIDILRTAHPDQVYQHETLHSDNHIWKMLIKVLREAEPDFQLIGEFSQGDEIFYVYERVNNLGKR